jgi:hypothetical protein
MDMITIPIEPYYARLFEHYKTNIDPAGDVDGMFDWLKEEYNAYQVFISSTPSRDGAEKGFGLWFPEESEATLFTLKWS